ncbi:MAG: putative manganese-dependent inorganic diphosphatase, partial [Chloroflexi bacterium]|nr:putative manganese-dependent inorganic diphosphatase [Chloroflexota bacterium]
KVVDALDGEVLYEGPVRELRNEVRVAGMALETALGRFRPGILLVVGDRDDIQRGAIELGVGAIVVTGDLPVKAEILELARRRGVTVISVPYDTYNTVRRIHLSLPISYLMRHDVTSCDLEDLVDDVRPLFQRARAVPVLDDDGRVVGVITRADLVRPVRRRVALVDHNERGQSVRGIEQAEIVAVVDHHRIADVQTSIPPIMRVEPLGACSTLIAKLYAESGATMSPNVAGILLSGILTDTLLFRSPTTTDEDRRIAAQLAHRAGVDLVELGQAILAEASNLAGRRPEDLLGMDFKEFTFDGARFGVSVIETANADVLTPRHDDLYEALRRLRDQQSYASVLLAVIDITKEQTSILVDGHAETIAESFGVRLQDGRWIKLPGVYSRKKQIVPTLARARAQLPK